MHGRPSVIASTDDEVPDIVVPVGFSRPRQVAIGGSAAVFAVTDASGAPAILKWGRWRDGDIRARFANEAAILGALGPPLTPRLVAHGEHAGWPFLLMEELVGETLATWMSRTGDGGSVGEIVALLQRLARALEAVHGRGYVHGDLKPENVVLGAREPRLLDFGLTTREGSLTTQAGSVVGTVHYLAPEQLRTGAVIDRRVDLYALGVIAYEMLAGVPPFVGERRAIEYQHRVVRPAPLRELRPLPVEIEDIVLRCLEKQPEARPQTAGELHARLAAASAAIETLKGVGSGVKKSLGAQNQAVLAYIEGGDPITITRAINDVHGIIVRGRPGSVLAAFATQFHDAPLAVAVSACRAIADENCRVVLHAAQVLVRRTAHGKPAFYGAEIEAPAAWTPARSFAGLVLTRAAAELAGGAARAAADLPQFFRMIERDRTDGTDVHSEVRLIGRDRTLAEVAAVAGAGGMLIGISGGEGIGKSRLLASVVERLRANQREVIALRGRRRLVGDRPDDERLIDALGGSSDLASALVEATARKAILVIDEVQWFSAAVREQLWREELALSRVVASREPPFEVAPGMTKRLAIELLPLPFPEADRLLRELLVPARLIPDVLLQRLAIRAGGNPGLLVALARDIKQRGGIRRQEGSDDWYVAADEIDTLLAAPSAEWLASRGLERLPAGLAPVVRPCSALGPTFTADEVAQVAALTDASARLAALVSEGVFATRHGWFEFVDASLQDAIYEHVLDERSLVHARALAYHLARRSPNLVGWLARVAYHAAGCDQLATAAACWRELARAAHQRGEHDLAGELERRSGVPADGTVPDVIALAARELG